MGKNTEKTIKNYACPNCGREYASNSHLCKDCKIRPVKKIKLNNNQQNKQNKQIKQKEKGFKKVMKQIDDMKGSEGSEPGSGSSTGTVPVPPSEGPEEDLPPPGGEPARTPTKEEIEQEYNEEEKEEIKTKTLIRGGRLTEDGFCLLFRFPFDIVNKIVDEVVDDDSEYKELMDLIYFNDKEINDSLHLAYVIVECYYPHVLEYLAGEGLIQIIAILIAVSMIYYHKVKNIVKWIIKHRKEKKERKELDAGHGKTENKRRAITISDKAISISK